ncbi:hypothetical protein FBU59_000965, partial [Linderina macrospora]
QLIQELEEEESRSKAKEKRKQKKKEREKEKKRSIQQKKEEERLAREQQQKAELERKKAAEEKRRLEREKKKREEAARVRKVQEERNRKILEQADRRLERERQEKLQREQEQLEKLQREREERERNEKERLERKEKAKAMAIADATAAAESEEKRKKGQAEKQKQLEDEAKAMAAEDATSFVQTQTEEPAAQLQAAADVVEPPTQPAASVVPATPVAAVAAVPAAPLAEPTVAAPVPPEMLGTPLSAILPAAPAMAMPQAVPPPGMFSSPRMLPLDVMGRTPAAVAAPSYPLAQTPRQLGHSFEPMAPQPQIPYSSPSARARANSGSQVFPGTSALLASPVVSSLAGAGSVSATRTAPPPPPQPTEYDAEILSIVGKVMGSRTLQDELTDGLEWRAEPDSFMGSSSNGPLAGPPKSSLAATFGLGSSPVAGPSIIDHSVRRNSMPMHRASSESRLATLAPGGTRGGLALDVDIEAVYSAYCAVEKFQREGKGVSGRNYQSVSEIAQMHGKLGESEVWSICSKYARANPAACMLDHSTRSVMFMREAGDQASSHLASIAPTPVSNTALPLGFTSTLPTMGLSSSGLPQFGVEARSTPSSQLSIITEDMLSAFSLQTAQGHSPMQMTPQQTSQLQARSPMLYTQFNRQSRLTTPLKTAMIPTARYTTDRFQEREAASENQYMRKREAEKLQALKAQLDKAKQQVEELQGKIDDHHKEAAAVGKDTKSE